MMILFFSNLDYSPPAKTEYGHVQSLSQLAEDLADKIKTFSEVMDAVGTLLQVQSLSSLLKPSRGSLKYHLLYQPSSKNKTIHMEGKDEMKTEHSWEHTEKNDCVNG